MKFCSKFMFVSFMSTIQNQIFLFYHSSFPWPSNFLQNTLSFFHQYIAPALYNVRTFHVAVLTSLILFPLPRFIPLSLTVVSHSLGILTACLPWQVVGLSPNPQSEVPVHRIYNPRDNMAQLYPWHRVPLLVAFYDLHGLQWYYSFSPSQHTRT
jgi:hypothetical protein